jgi:ribonuclease D
MSIFIHHKDLPSDFKISGDIAIDTETMGLNLFRDRLCVLQFSNGNGDAHLVTFDGRDYSAPNLKRILSNEKEQKIFHFARFDLAIMKKYLNLDIKNVFCTKIASKLTRTYTDSHGLKELCRELLNVNLSKQQQSSDWGSDTLSNDQQEYAARDVLYLHQIRTKLSSMLEREGRMEMAKTLFKFLPIRIELDLMGFGDENKTDIFAHN